MTERYAHHSPESLREGVNVLDVSPSGTILTQSAKQGEGEICNHLNLSGEPPGTRTQGPRLKSTDTGEENQHDDSSQPSDE